MKPYNERLPLIDAAIDKLKGVFPPTAIGYSGRGYYAKGDFANILHGVNIGDVCTRQEFEQRKAELQNKPSWEDALEWANWLAQDANGSWYWWERKPELSFKAFDDDEGLYFRCSKGGKVIGNWQDTLEQRPTATEKEQNMNDWYEEGGLPPVGAVVELYFGGLIFDDGLVKNWKTGDLLEVLAHRIGENGVPVAVVWNKRDCFATCLVSKALRPLRTETDKLIEQMKRDLSGEWGVSLQRANAICSHLIKKGYRKAKPMSEDEFIDASELDHDTGLLLYRAGCRFLDQGE